METLDRDLTSTNSPTETRAPLDPGLRRGYALDLRRGDEASFPPNQVNDSKKGSNGPAGSRSGKLHSEERDGLSVTGRSPATQSPVKDPRVNSQVK